MLASKPRGSSPLVESDRGQHHCSVHDLRLGTQPSAGFRV